MHASNIIQATCAETFFFFGGRGVMFVCFLEFSGKNNLIFIRMKWTASHVKPEPGQQVIYFKIVINLETSSL